MKSSEPSPTAASPEITVLEPATGVAPGIGHYIAQLTETRAELLRSLDGLTPEQLSWHPNDEVESIGTQLLHVAAVEWSWVFEEIFRRSSDEYDGWEEAMPIRAGIAQVSARPLSAFTDRLDRVRADIVRALTGLTDADLGRLVADATPSPGTEAGSHLYAIDWILFHLVEHEAHHAGQVELLVRLLPPELSRDQDPRPSHP